MCFVLLFFLCHCGNSEAANKQVVAENPLRLIARRRLLDVIQQESQFSRGNTERTLAIKCRALAIGSQPGGRARREEGSG